MDFKASLMVASKPEVGWLMLDGGKSDGYGKVWEEQDMSEGWSQNENHPCHVANSGTS